MTGSLPPFAASRMAREEKAARRVLEAGLWMSPVNRISKLVWDRERGWWTAHMASGGVLAQPSFPFGLHVSETPGETSQARYVLVAWPPPPDTDPCAATGHVLVDVEDVDGGILRRCDVCEDELVEHPDGTVTPVRKAGEVMAELTRIDIAELPDRIATLAKFDATSITDDDGWTLGCDTTDVELSEGALVEYWGRGIGYTVRGLAIGGHVFWYRTVEQQATHEAAERERHDRQRRDEFEADRAKHDQRYEALPDTFRARIDRYRKGNPNFRWEFEPYEVMCCTDALRIASWCSINRVATEFEGDEPTAAENVMAFQALPWERQQLAGIDDGHSGNSFGFACRLAYLWVTDPGLVEFEHGALTPLVGCVNYGCTHGQDGES